MLDISFLSVVPMGPIAIDQALYLAAIGALWRDVRKLNADRAVEIRLIAEATIRVADVLARYESRLAQDEEPAKLA